MSWFKSNIIDSITGLFTAAGDAIDKNVTSDHERISLKNDLVRIQAEFETKTQAHIENLEQQISLRHKYDMQSDSWLSKNVRPLTLIFLTVAIVVLAYCSIFTLNKDDVDVMQPWITLFTTLMVTVYGFYFGSRGIEKCSQLLAEHKRNKLLDEIAALKLRISQLENTA